MDITGYLVEMPTLYKVLSLLIAVWLLLPARSGASCALKREKNEKIRKKHKSDIEKKRRAKRAHSSPA